MCPQHASPGTLDPTSQGGTIDHRHEHLDTFTELSIRIEGVGQDNGARATGHRVGRSVGQPLQQAQATAADFIHARERVRAAVDHQDDAAFDVARRLLKGLGELEAEASKLGKGHERDTVAPGVNEFFTDSDSQVLVIRAGISKGKVLETLTVTFVVMRSMSPHGFVMRLSPTGLWSTIE
jgi:hypothetical protein